MYAQNIKGCKFIDVTNPVFLWCYFQELQNAHQNFHGFCMHSLLWVVPHVTCLRVLCITSSDVGQNMYVWCVKIVTGCNLLSWLNKEWMGKCVYPNEVMATSKCQMLLFMFIWFSNCYKPIFYQWNLGSWKFEDGQLTMKITKIAFLETLFMYTCICETT